MWQKMLQVGSGGGSEPTNRQYLFKKGNGIPSDWVTYSGTNGTATVTADKIITTSVSGSSNNMGFRTKNTIDLTDWDIVIVEYTLKSYANSSYGDTYINIIGATTESDIASKYASKTNYTKTTNETKLGTYISAISVVGLTTGYYIGGGGCFEADITNIWLEKHL